MSAGQEDSDPSVAHLSYLGTGPLEVTALCGVRPERAMLFTSLRRARAAGLEICPACLDPTSVRVRARSTL
jgi:hypothetical protein